MGRRATKKVTVNGTVTLHQRYLYREFLQIACIDLTRSHHPVMWLLLWDPTQPVATRPLAIQKDGTWYTYGPDLTKNVCEVFGTTGYISTAYTYTPFGEVTASGSVTQPIQWSSEFYDEELGMVYYNYRHYNTRDGRWIGRDKIEAKNLYTYIENSQLMYIDLLGYFSMPSCNSKRDIGNNRIVIKRTGLSNAGSERTFDKTFEMLNDQLFYIGLLSKFSTYSQTTMLGLANLKLHYTSWQNITEDAVYNIFDDKVLPSVGKQERNQIVKALIQIDKNLAENKWGTKIDVEVAHEKCEEEFCLFGSNEFEWTQQQTLIFSFVVKKSGKIARWQKGKNTIVNIMPPSQIKDVHIAQAELLAAYEANKKWNLTVGY